MVQRYEVEKWGLPEPEVIEYAYGDLVKYEDYAKLEARLNGILDMLVKLDNDLGYGLIPDEYAYDRVGEILEKYRNGECANCGSITHVEGVE